MVFAHAVAAGLLQALAFLWDSLFGLIFGFLVSAIVQVVLTPAAMHRYLGPNVRGILYAAGFGIISSACSYGAAAAARGFYQRGADVRSVFAFLISSTNMNVAIVILFWSLLGWKFAFAEFAGGIIIIAVVVTGFSLLFSARELDALREQAGTANLPAVVTECPLCGMEGEPELAVSYGGRTYLACGNKHYNDLKADPARALGESAETKRTPLWRVSTWRSIVDTAIGDVQMLKNELLVGYLVAGFAAALVPPQWLSHALATVGAVPFFGYFLLLVVGLLIAVATFVCSMGNVPVARFLANAGIPLGANTAFIYGDLLVLPLIAIYFKSFPKRVAWTFVVLFTAGAIAAGAVMGITIGDELGGITMGSMALNDRLTLISNIVAIAAVGAIAATIYFSKPSRASISA